MNDKAIPRLPDTGLVKQLKDYGVPLSNKALRGNKEAKQPTLADEFLINLRIQDLQDFIGRYK